MENDVLSDYLAFERASDELAEGYALRSAAEWLTDRLPTTETVLLARTDAALMLCAACAVLREQPTTVHRAFFGRIGWTPPDEAILVEAPTPNPGLLDMLAEGWPELQTVAVPDDALTSASAVPAAY